MSPPTTDVMPDIPRESAGQPSGGRFATKTNDEADGVTLGAREQIAVRKVMHGFWRVANGCSIHSNGSRRNDVKEWQVMYPDDTLSGKIDRLEDAVAIARGYNPREVLDKLGVEPDSPEEKVVFASLLAQVADVHTVAWNLTEEELEAGEALRMRIDGLDTIATRTLGLTLAAVTMEEAEGHYELDEDEGGFANSLLESFRGTKYGDW